MQVGRHEISNVRKKPVENISHGGINYEFQRGEKYSVKQVWVNGKPYPIKYIQDRSIDEVQVQLSHNDIGHPDGLVITSNFPVPTKWRRTLKKLVRSIYAKFVEMGYLQKCDDADIAEVVRFIVEGEKEDTIKEISRPTKRIKNAAELLPDMKLTGRDIMAIARICPIKIHR